MTSLYMDTNIGCVGLDGMLWTRSDEGRVSLIGKFMRLFR